jgi:hypothetical protein
LSPIRILGSVLSLLNGLWAAVLAYFGFIPVPLSCNVSPSPCSGAPTFFGIPSPYLHGALFAVGMILIIDALVSFKGVRMSFMLGAILSAVVLALFAISWGGVGTSESEVALVLSVVTILTDAVASRPARALSERDSPLNLPVFG